MTYPAERKAAIIAKMLQPLGVRQVHPAILGLQLVERGRAQPMLPAQFGGRQTSLLLLDHPDDLRLGETALPHVVCSFSGWADSTSQRGNFRGAGHRPHGLRRSVPAGEPAV